MPEQPKQTNPELLNNSRSDEYLDIDGAELDIPAVQRISEALHSGENFMVVGGGGSGKTESITTAFELREKESDVFDLREWTISHLADEQVRSSGLEDPNIGVEARGFLVALGEILALHKAAGAETTESIKAIIKELYLTDRTYGIKFAEGYMLDRAIGQLQVGGENPDTLASELQEIMDSPNEVLVVDEFDMAIGDDHTPIEIENATKVINFAKQKNAQLGIVVHPDARKDPYFMRAITGALGEGGEVEEIDMGYFPESVEKAALSKIGIDGELAIRFMEEVQGFPTAYLDLCIKPGLREQLLRQEPEERFHTILGLVEAKIAKNKAIVFDRMTPEAQKYVTDLVNGVETPTASKEVIDEALISLYVSENAGKVFMPPVLKRTLAN